LKKTKASEVLKSNSEQLLAQLKSGELAFSKLADNPAYTVISETQVSRSSSTAGRELSRAIFGMARPGVDEGNIASVSLSSGNQVIVHLHQVVDGNWQSLSEPEQKAIRMQLNRANSSQSIGALQHAIRGRAEITLL
jgi:hypothetical protein